MREAGLTKQERGLLTLTRVLMVLFFLATALFITLPNWTLNYLTDIGQVFFNFRNSSITLGTENFWLILAIGYTATLTYVCLIAQNDFLRNIDYVKIVIFAKFVSTLGFVICFLKFEYRFFCLVGAIIDFTIFLITWSCYHAAKKSRST